MCQVPEPPTNQDVSSVDEDWTDNSIKPSERKKRDRILPNGVVLKLMKKSDWEGCKRFFSNMGFMFLTALAIHHLDVFPSIRDAHNLEDLWSVVRSDKMLAFAPLYFLYSFQMQCMAFAGGHELLHGNAFKTKWMNTVVTFFVSTAFFEVLWHERINHKQHHIFTLDIDRDPELTSFFPRKELAALKFKSVPSSRYSYVKSFINVFIYFYHRVFRLISSSMGIATDYTGIGWSMQSPKRDELDPSVVSDLQLYSLLQLGVYVVIFTTFGTTLEGMKSLVFWWMAPCVIGYAPIHFIRNAEHADCDLVPNQLHNTRTVESNRIIRWLLWETNFHCEHHAYPMVPFYNLSVLHDLLDPYIKHNDCKTFTGQNWQMIKPGGWIDKQNS
jgi:fatty acid desaturase